MTTPIRRIYNVFVKRLPETQLKYKDIPLLPTLPPSVDLRSKCAPIYDQGELGSCTANAISACYAYDNKNVFIPSRLFIYYNERKLEGTISEDSGAFISDGIKTLKTYGVCPEPMWPYDITKFTKAPTTSCYKNALTHKALSCTNIKQNLTAMKNSLASGFPFVVGIAVYSSFETAEVAKSGVVPLPNTSTEDLLGGHAILCVGYDDSKSVWIMRNSWGTSWGNKGYFTLPYHYLLDADLSSELWNITKITDKPKSFEGSDEIADLQTQIDVIGHKIDKLLERL